MCAWCACGQRPVTVSSAPLLHAHTNKTRKPEEITANKPGPDEDAGQSIDRNYVYSTAALAPFLIGVDLIRTQLGFLPLLSFSFHSESK